MGSTHPREGEQSLTITSEPTKIAAKIRNILSQNTAAHFALIYSLI